jgi:hypothetical protein
MHCYTGEQVRILGAKPSCARTDVAAAKHNGVGCVVPFVCLRKRTERLKKKRKSQQECSFAYLAFRDSITAAKSAWKENTSDQIGVTIKQTQDQAKQPVHSIKQNNNTR